MRDNALVLDGRTGGDPGGSGKVIESTSTTAAGWVTANLAKVAAWLGFTPVNKAGDTMTGSLTVSGATSDVSVGRNIAATGGVSGASLSASGAVAAASASITGTASANTFSAANVAATSSLKRGGIEAALVGHTHGGSEITDLSIAEADLANDAVTAAKIAAGAVGSSELASGAAVANIGFTPARVVAGTYTGDGTANRQITTGFVCKYVIVTGVFGTTPSSVTVHILSATAGLATLQANNAGTALVTSTGSDRLHASDGFIVDAADINAVTNTSGRTYRYLALG